MPSPAKINSSVCQKSGVGGKLQRGFAFFVGKSVARNIARIRLLEKIGVIHRHPLGVGQLVGMTLPFRVMMGNVAQLIFAEPPEIPPGEIQSFPVADRQHGGVDIGDSRTIVVTFLADEFARVGQRLWRQLVGLFGDMLGFRGDRTVRHRKISAFADGPSKFTEMVAIGKKQELEGFELVDAAAVLTRKIVQSLRSLAMGDGQTHVRYVSTNGARKQGDSA